MTTIQRIQQMLAIKADGIWGPRSQAAVIAVRSPLVIRSIQRALGVPDDAQWGPVSQMALNQEAHWLNEDSPWFSCKASSFADPADVAAFLKCKKTGKSDVACFAVGDNGIGQFGEITAQERVRMVAVHSRDMIARWGSVGAAAHRLVQVRVKGIEISATVEDRISAPGRIDLNPACAKALGLNPPFVVACEWRWA